MFDRSILKRLEALEKASTASRNPVEIYHRITMPDGSDTITKDSAEAERLEALGGKWDLYIVVNGATQ